MDFKKELDDLLSAVIREAGSDIHISEGRKPAIRVSGYLVPLVKMEELRRETVLGVLSLMIPKQSMDQFIKTKEADFSYGYKDGNRFRGNAYFQQGKAGIALRLIPKEIRTIAELNLPPILES